MGLFDAFKRKKNGKETVPYSAGGAAAHSPLFLLFDKYKEYITSFMMMQQQGNYAPIAAYEKEDGSITGYLYLAEDESYNMPIPEVLARMEAEFENRLRENSIISRIILYHSQYDHDDNHQYASTNEELKAITVNYKSSNGLEGKTGIPYQFGENQIRYASIGAFSHEENGIIFGASLQEGRNYFEEQVKTEPETTVTGAGITVKKVNNGHLENTWCGIFGFETFRNGNGGQMLKDHYDVLFTNGWQAGDVSIFEMNFNGIIFRGLALNGNAITVMPIVITQNTIPIENKEIREWVNVESLEAVVTGNGRSTFGVTYFATDYAENRERYANEKMLDISLSGIVFVLDTGRDDEEDREIKFAPDYCGYLPNSDLAGFGCFDFVGVLEAYREFKFLSDNSLRGYILTVRLINHPDTKDFFTINMFVNPENMRFTNLEAGMKITGMFQMQGHIAHKT